MTKDDKVDFTGTVEKDVNTGLTVDKPTGTALVADLLNTDNNSVIDKTVVIKESNTSIDKTSPNSDEDAKNGVGTGSVIEFNPTNHNSTGETPIINADGSTGADPKIFLGHELAHAKDMLYGTDDNSTAPGKLKDPDSKLTNVLSKSEVKARQTENLIRKENHVVARKTPTSEPN